uniref:Uncharacterized protein n=1 Tax=Setaria digitata TaxID=48799 RepID=A0A915PVZ3_9BILA
MNCLFTDAVLPEQDLKANASSSGCSKTVSVSNAVPVNKNDEAQVSLVLAQVEQKGREAVDVLLKISEKNKKKMLFPEVDQLLHVQFVYKKPSIVPTEHHVKRFILPHPLHEKGNTTVCLIMRDLDYSAEAKRDPDVDKQARLWAEKLEHEFGVTKEHVQKILTKTQLEREYHSYYDRRQLASAYDIFLVDVIVEKSVIGFCGKEFHKAKKIPLRLSVHPRKSLIKEIEKAYYTVTFPLSPYRTRTSIRVGNLCNPADHVVENIRRVAESVFQYCPGGLCNIRSISLQMVTGGPSLPLYIDAGSRNMVNLPKPMKMKDIKLKRDKSAIIDDLSTLPEGMEVMVHRDGEVIVLDSDTKKPVLYPTVNDEWEARDDLKPLINPAKQEILLEKRRKLKEKRRKALKAKKRLLPPLKDKTSITGLLKKNKNIKRSEIGRFKDRKEKSKNQRRTNKKSKVSSKKSKSKC